MAWWKKVLNLLQDDAGEEEVDFYREGLQLLQQEKYHEALTSFRLALRDQPGDTTILQQIAITFTRIGMTDEAVKTYRDVLQRDPGAAGAHYGLAFLLLRQGDAQGAIRHLRAFLADPPSGGAAGRHITHARRTLAELTGAVEEEVVDG